MIYRWLLALRDHLCQWDSIDCGKVLMKLLCGFRDCWIIRQVFWITYVSFHIFSLRYLNDQKQIQASGKAFTIQWKLLHRIWMIAPVITINCAVVCWLNFLALIVVTIHLMQRTLNWTIESWLHKLWGEKIVISHLFLSWAIVWLAQGCLHVTKKTMHIV